MSFADASFDVVLTSDVFEHLHEVEQAEAEVVRVLRPGGTYCFTVPFAPNDDDDIILARDRDDGTVEHLAEPQYHGDPLRPGEGILVYRIFTHRRLKERFEALGCTYETFRMWSPGMGILGWDSFVMAATKVAP
jgi:SAM-dependent methyltransferase